MGCKEKEALLVLIQISIGSFPSKYLDLPLSHNYLKAKDCVPLIDKFGNYIEGWMGTMLSFSGRIEIINSVLTNVIGYWHQTLKLLISTCRELERLAANFLRKGRMHAWIWDSLCKPKREDGVGIKKVTELNIVGDIKLFWRFCTSKCLWATRMRATYLKGNLYV